MRTTPGRANSIALACAAARAAAAAARDGLGGFAGLPAGVALAAGVAAIAAARPVAGRPVVGFTDAGLPGAERGVVSRIVGLADALDVEPFLPATAAARPGAERAGAIRDAAPRCGMRDVGFGFVIAFSLDARAGADFRECTGDDFLPPEVFFKALVLNREGFFTFDLATEPLAPFGPGLAVTPVS